MSDDRSTPLLLSGRVVLADGSARHRYLLVRDGRIAWVGVSRPPEALLRGAREIVTGPRAWVFPGLLNLHTHATYNVLPLWYSRLAPFNNRFEWRNDPGYRAEISDTIGSLRSLAGSQQTVAIVSELQAIAGGTTVLDKTTRLDGNTPADPAIVLCRDIGNPTDIGLPADRRIDSVVDFFVPEDGRPVPKPGRDGAPSPIDAYAAARDAGRLGAVLVHLAEGRTGSGSGRGVDPYSRQELEAFMQHPALREPEQVRAVPLSLVHGCGIDVRDPAHLEFLRERQISVIWSPVSNLLLYGDTLDAARLLQEGINVALGSDWSPSGSKHVWEEARFARRYLAAIGAAVSDAEIFRMVTVNAARCLGTSALGRIDVDAFADLFIVESTIDSDSALEVFFATEDRDVLATLVAGVPIYGRTSFLRQFELPLQNLPRREGSAAADKAVYLPPSVTISLESAIDAVEDHLKARTPAVQRSNLLASSDKPYQRRMQRLRSQVERFGWSARQTAKRLAKGEPPMNGRVPVPPASVRVWCGYLAARGAPERRTASRPWRRFLETFGGVVVPSTVMLMRELGLTAYFPAVPPPDRPAACPDAVAIAFYESPQTCAAAARHVGGRLHSLLHEALFKNGPRGSWSAFPSRFPAPSAEELRARTTWHLFDDPVDWYCGRTRVCIGVRDPERHDAKGFHAAVQQVCLGLTQNPGAVDGAILALDDDCFVVWDHRTTPRGPDDEHVRGLEGCGRLVMCEDAVDASANGQLFEPWDGFSLKGGECLRLTFERRSFYPW